MGATRFRARNINRDIASFALNKYAGLSIERLQLCVRDLQAMTESNCGWDVYMLRGALILLAQDVLFDKTLKRQKESEKALRA